MPLGSGETEPTPSGSGELDCALGVRHGSRLSALPVPRTHTVWASPVGSSQSASTVSVGKEWREQIWRSPSRVTQSELDLTPGQPFWLESQLGRLAEGIGLVSGSWSRFVVMYLGRSRRVLSPCCLLGRIYGEVVLLGTPGL